MAMLPDIDALAADSGPDRRVAYLAWAYILDQAERHKTDPNNILDHILRVLDQQYVAEEVRQDGAKPLWGHWSARGDNTVAHVICYMDGTWYGRVATTVESPLIMNTSWDINGKSKDDELFDLTRRLL